MGQILATGKKPKWKDFAWEEGKTSCGIWETGISFPNNTICRSCSNEDEVFPSCVWCCTAMRCNYFWLTPWHLQAVSSFLFVFSVKNPTKKLNCTMERNMQNPSHSRRKFYFSEVFCVPIGDGDRAGYSSAETSRTQLLSKGGNAEIGNTNPAWMPT